MGTTMSGQNSGYEDYSIARDTEAAAKDLSRIPGRLYDKCMEDKKAATDGDMVIAIDGPAGAGKSTVAQKLAQVMQLRYLDTGAMYRALTLKALRAHIDLDDEEELTGAAMDMELQTEYASGEKPPYRMIMDGEDITEAIRSREVSTHVSQVSSQPGVRREMVRKQRELAGGGDIIVEGRDVGTVVFPSTPYKFFITASVKERARRRFKEMKKDGYNVSQKTIQQEMVKRDHQDSTREVNPLRCAPDAQMIDTTGKSVSQVVERLLESVQRRRSGAGGGR
jgi:CMP/dCMP kinase